MRGIDLRVPAGSSTGLLGRNGAGKSTTMRVLAGVIPPTGGLVEVAGHDVRTETLAVKRLTGPPRRGRASSPGPRPGSTSSSPPACAGSRTAGRSGPATCSSASTSAAPRTG